MKKKIFQQTLVSFQCV